MLAKSCPKFTFIEGLVSYLDTMKARISLEDKLSFRVIHVLEKLVVVLTNPVVYAIFERVGLSSLNYHVDVITTCH